MMFSRFEKMAIISIISEQPSYIVYLHHICKPEAWSREGKWGTLFSKPKKICGQNQVSKKYS